MNKTKKGEELKRNPFDWAEDNGEAWKYENRTK